MMGRKMAIMGLALACATCFFAVSAMGASAAGPTWATCSKEVSGTKRWSDATCKTENASGEFYTKTLPLNTATAIEPKITSAKFTLASTNAGIKFKIGCTGLSGPGTIENTESGGAMVAKGRGIVLTFSGCTVEEPAGKSCVVEAGGTSGKIVTNSLRATGMMTTETENQVKYEAEPEIKEGKEIAKPFVVIKVSGCTTTALNGNKEVTGSATGISNESTGMTLQTFTSTSSALLFGGQPSTFLGENDVVMKETNNQIGLATTP